MTEIEPATRRAWRTWLTKHHADETGVWVIFRRSGHAGPRSPGYEDLVEEALCFGWVDSRPGRVDEARTKLYFSPRKPGSGWAASNKARVERLTDLGQMAPAGLAAVARAQADGSWSRIDGSESGVVPDDLRAALDAVPVARTHFDGFPPGARRAILQWIEQARTPATRAKRIRETVDKAELNERANQWKPTSS